MHIEKVNANCKWEKIEKKKPKPQNPAAWSADTWKIFCPGSYYEPGRKVPLLPVRKGWGLKGGGL